MVRSKKAWKVPGNLTMIILGLCIFFLLFYIIFKESINKILG